MKLFTFPVSVIIFSVLALSGFQATAKDVTLDGETVKGPTPDIKVTYALNKTDKIARVKEVRDRSATGTKSSCVIPAKIKVDGVTYKVTKIGKDAFGYESFDKVVLPNTIDEICEGAFAHVLFLSDCKIPSSVVKIGKNAFANNLLTKVTIPASVTSIGDGAFSSNGLHELYFEASSKPLTIGANAFRKNCFGPYTLVLPERITSIGDGAFADASQLNTLVINSRIIAIPANCFNNCRILVSVEINGSVATIGTSAFAGCEVLSTVTLATNSLKSIGANAFAGCNIRKIDNKFFMFGLNDIGDGAFSNNTELTSVNLPVTIKSIGSNAFANDNKIMAIDCVTLDVPQLAESAFTGNVYENCKVNVLGDMIPQFRTASGWRNFKWFLDAGVDDVVTDEADGEPLYFNLRGEPVANPEIPGIYIELRNGKSRKIYVR